MTKGRSGGGRLKSTGQDSQAAHHRGEGGSHGNGCSKGLGDKKMSPLRAAVAGGGVDGLCVGERRGAGARVARADILDSRSTDVDYDLDAPSPVEAPSLHPSFTYACVEEGLGKGAKAAEVGARVSVEDAGSPDGKSADAGFVEASNKGASGGRLASHQQAGPSPLCTWSWVEAQLNRKMEVYYECIGLTNILFLDWSVKLPRSTVCHIVGKRGHTLQRIEDFCGVFVALRDIDEEQSEVLLWGPPEGVALADFVVQALKKGLHSILDSLGRIGF